MKSKFFVILTILFISANTLSALATPFENVTKSNLVKPIPILTYHLVTDDVYSPNTSLFVEPTEFENQMKWLVENGYTPIFASELKSASSYKKPIIITFDDGYIDNYDVVFPIIKEYNIKITIFIITDSIDKKRYLSSENILEMHKSKLVSIQSHTASHKYLSKLSRADIISEFATSKERITEITGESPTVVSYPYGDFNKTVTKISSKYFDLGFSTYVGTLSNTKNNYSIKRFTVSRETKLDGIVKYLKNPAKGYS